MSECIGLLADIQYADRADRGSARFRSSLARLEAVLEAFQARGCSRLIQLGDVIEGHSPGEGTLESTRAELQAVVRVLQRAALPVEHVVGNHCLALSRAELRVTLGGALGPRVIEIEGARLVLLDSMAWSLQGTTSAGEDPDPEAWLSQQDAPQAIPWNGGLGARQRDWLAEVCSGATPVLVASHHPVARSAAREAFLAWDHQETWRTFVERAPAGSLWVSGHDHRGGLLEGSHRHLTVPGIVAGQGSLRLESSQVGAVEVLWPVWAPPGRD